MQLESSDFSARLRHYLQSEEIIHADYQGSFSSQSRVLRLHWIKITETCHLLAHRGREVGLVSVEHHQTFTQTLRHIHPSLNHKNIIIQFQSLSKFVSHPLGINEWKVVHILASISPEVLTCRPCSVQTPHPVLSLLVLTLVTALRVPLPHKTHHKTEYRHELGAIFPHKEHCDNKKRN